MFLRVGVPNPFTHNQIFTVRPDGTDVIEITPTLRDFFVVWYYPPIWSPNGLRIAFGSFDGANMEINIADANGSNTQYFEGSCAEFVPNGCSSASLPAWSPDGGTIAFVNRGNQSGTEIYTKNIGSGEVRRLTDTPGVNSNPNWKPLPLSPLSGPATQSGMRFD